MLSRTSGLLFALISCSLGAQPPHPSAVEQAIIERVKALKVSSLDNLLPDVTLEFFLKYEGEGAPIQWGMGHCDQLKRNLDTEREQEAAICVEAEADLKDGRSARIVVSLGTLKGHAVSVPTVFSIEVSDQRGITRNVRRLGDLPMALHRPPPPPPKTPRDLPLPAGAARWPYSAWPGGWS